jgi:outer membrane receptor protein involved in Fe transport
MSDPRLSAAAAVGCGGLFLIPPLAAAAESLAPLVLTGERVAEPCSPTTRQVGPERLRTADTADLLRDLPGAAVIRNGPQTGIVQVRGLTGDRVAVRVDGMAITPACPNHMDPPLHYAAPGDGDRIELFAGIAPVSAAGDQIGGMVAVIRAHPEFAADAQGWLTRGRFGASFLGSHDATLATADLTLPIRPSPSATAGRPPPPTTSGSPTARSGPAATNGPITI